METREHRLIDSVESLLPEMMRFTRDLVAQPSTLGNEAGALEVMAAELETLGFASRRVAIDPERLSSHPGFAPVPWSYAGRYNVIAQRAADQVGGKSAIFNGHLDVVSPEPTDRWERNPFEPYEKEGWLYGRGAGDMKAGIAAMTYALKAVEKAGFGLKAPVFIEAVIEEECSGNGALACRQAGIDADAVLIPEPFGPTILTTQIGVAWFKVTLSGVPVHVLDARGGVNAIEKCVPLFTALRALEQELNRHPHPAFAGVPHPANLTIGIIKGGDWPSTVPALFRDSGKSSKDHRFSRRFRPLAVAEPAKGRFLRLSFRRASSEPRSARFQDAWQLPSGPQRNGPRGLHLDGDDRLESLRSVRRRASHLFRSGG